MINSNDDYSIENIRSHFPIFNRKINNNILCYLDSAASSQQPECVINTVNKLHDSQYSNIHRGVHTLSMESTDLYEKSREKIRSFINAKSTQEIIFTSGATESINLVAQSYVRSLIQPNDEILITHMEHHSNIVPWQIICDQTGASLKVVPVNDNGELKLDEFNNLINNNTRIVCVSHVSNALGTINPIKKIIDTAHSFGIPVLVDGAQSVSHIKVDVSSLDVDFYAFSGHKLYGPTGIGVLYGKKDLLEKMPPYQGGGDMILSVTFDKTEYNILPYKFEAGTPNISGVIGLGSAIDFINLVGIDRIAEHEDTLTKYALDKLNKIPEVRIIGNANQRAGLVSFVINGIHPHDLGTIFDQQGIAIRAGHHCAQPLMDRYGVPATARASFGMYNTKKDIDSLIAGIHEAIRIFI